jgi:hypothetical protein
VISAEMIAAIITGPVVPTIQAVIRIMASPEKYKQFLENAIEELKGGGEQADRVFKMVDPKLGLTYHPSYSTAKMQLDESIIIDPDTVPLVPAALTRPAVAMAGVQQQRDNSFADKKATDIMRDLTTHTVQELNDRLESALSSVTVRKSAGPLTVSDQHMARLREARSQNAKSVRSVLNVILRKMVAELAGVSLATASKLLVKPPLSTKFEAVRAGLSGLELVTPSGETDKVTHAETSRLFDPGLKSRIDAAKAKPRSRSAAPSQKAAKGKKRRPRGAGDKQNRVLANA